MAKQKALTEIGVTLKGDKELRRLLKRIPEKAALPAMSQAVGRAVAPVRKAARDKIRKQSEETGELRKSLSIKRVKYKRSGTVVAVVGPRKDSKNPETGRNPANYAHLVEGGHRTPGGLWVEPRPFLKPAVEETKPQVATLYRAQLKVKLNAAIQREAARLKKKGASR